MAPSSTTPQPYSLKKLSAYFLQLGATAFGGPLVLVAHMEEDLVKERGWIQPEEFLEGLALAQIAPGPVASQLAMYLGWLRSGAAGATAAAAAVISPSLVAVLVLGALYVRAASLPWIHHLSYGIGAAVVAIMARNAQKLIQRTFRKETVRWSLGAVACALTLSFPPAILPFLALSGVIAVIVRNKAKTALRAFVPPFLLSGLQGPVGAAKLTQLLGYFLKIGSVVFGGGMAIVPFLHAGVVEQFHWLDSRQFLDAVAVGMITPGPFLITAAFVGYLAAGPVGALVATFGAFFPSYAIVLVAAPHFTRLNKNERVKALVEGFTAAALGSLVGAALLLSSKAVVDLPTALIALGTLFVMLGFPRVHEFFLIVAAGSIGMLLHYGGQ